MAMFTLAQAKNLSQDKLTSYVIDEFRTSPLLDAMVFDDTVKPQGGNTMTYVYSRVKTLATAAGRALNAEYTPQQADTEQVKVDLKVFGGSFPVSYTHLDKDHWIAELEKRVKKLQELVDHMVEVSDRLCPDEESDHLEDGEEVFDHGRGQGIFEMCMEVKRIIS